MPRIGVGAVILFSLQHFIAPFFIVLPLLQSLVPRACKQGSKIKAGAIKCCKENKITDPPNAWHNIPLHHLNQHFPTFCSPRSFITCFFVRMHVPCQCVSVQQSKWRLEPWPHPPHQVLPTDPCLTDVTEYAKDVSSQRIRCTDHMDLSVRERDPASSKKLTTKFPSCKFHKSRAFDT